MTISNKCQFFCFLRFCARELDNNPEQSRRKCKNADTSVILIKKMFLFLSFLLFVGNVCLFGNFAFFYTSLLCMLFILRA